MTSWVSIAYGALDMRDWHENRSEVEVMLLPVYPIDEPIGLAGDSASLWRRLVDGPVADADLSEAHRVLVRELAEFGIASADVGHPARVTRLEKPWLLSPLHEFVYALVGSIARDVGIDLVFIKGPVVRKQGLRDHQHSGDVDVWVDPAKIEALTRELHSWGWKVLRDAWQGTGLHHSDTLLPGVWGCEIDLHRYFPGSVLPRRKAFEVLLAESCMETFAAVSVRVPDQKMHAAILAMNAIRPAAGAARSPRQASKAVAILRRGGPGVVDKAGTIGAVNALEDVLREAFPEARITVPLLGEWDVWGYRVEESRARAYISAFRLVPWRRRPRFVWRGIWPTREVALRSDQASRVKSRNTALIRVRRLLYGVGLLR